ncbi:MAG: serine/threonine protein kinase, partial [Deltaproteobacteria bacterium]
MLGTRLGSYRLLAKIGHGGMGEIFLAIHYGTVVTYRAVKRMHPHLCHDPKFEELFLREASILVELQPAHHPNLLQIYDIGSVGGVPYIAMEYVPGHTLREVCRAAAGRRRRPGETLIPVEHALEITLAVCAALEFLHTKIVAHRDLTPTNLLLTRHGSVKVLDFGIAKVEPHTCSFKGTLAYMSPEQVDHRSVDHRTDFYTLGMLLYKMLTGNRPPRFDRFRSPLPL